ncbi:hypothetical protein [Corynebacterium sp.]|uniref:hypothetical protein n=1 Tax=Corynebacterium sp. TaxID=1720 RepID=UPI0025C34D62|nr:hypothetical protein [Corynebacterium sp.]
MPPHHTTTIETAMLRTAALAISLTWPLWLAEAFTRKFPGTTGTGHWYPVASASVFLLADLLLLAACVCGHRGLLVVSLRTAAATVPLALVLLVVDSLTPGPRAPVELWFTVFISIPALAFALTVPLRVGLPAFIAVVGGTALANALLDHPAPFLRVATEVGFSLVYTLPLAVVTCATLRLARFIDSAGAKAHAQNVAATRVRARAAETTRFTALVHDNVLSTLSGISRGVLPTEPVGLRLTSAFDDAGTMSSAQFIEAVTTTVHRHTPNCTVTADAPTDVTLPGVAGANITLALAEVARNSRQHAGTDVERECHVSLSDAAVELRYTDHGPGFRPRDVRPTAAGLRVSVLGRMESTEGGAASIEPSPGEGTTVTLTWQGTQPPPAPGTEIRVGCDGRDRSAVSAMRTYDLTHLSHAVWVPYVAVTAALFTGMNILNGQPLAAGNLATNIIVVALTVLVVGGRTFRIPAVLTGFCAVGVVVLMELGRWQDLSTATGWSYGWHLMAASLFCSLLALRGRPAVALATLFIGAVVIEVTSASPVTPDTDFGAFRIIISGLLVISCVLVSFGIRFTLARLPEARQKLHDAELRRIAAEEISVYRQDRLRRLREELSPLVTATSDLTHVDDDLREYARLTELQMRDAIRSPLLDLPPVHAAVRAARTRGVAVQLLDDRTPSSPDQQEPDGPLHHALLRRILDVLAGTDTGTVTVRLLPRGRSAFATVSDGDGIRRYTRDGLPVEVGPL